ncbi:MAG: hypothetical protein AB8G17_14845 [Gammaproteobacteria bacterium]
MTFRRLRIALVCALFPAQLFVGIHAYAADVIVAPQDVPFGADTMVRDKVRDECNLEGKIAKFIVDFGKKKKDYTIVSERPASGAYHVLTAEIVEVVGAGGGAWSGAKAVKVKGQLATSSGEVIGTFSAGRYSGGGAFGGYKGTCAILGRCTKAIGKDIAQWLENPRMNSMLGDH